MGEPRHIPRADTGAEAGRSIKRTALQLLQIVDHFELKAEEGGRGNRIEVADAAAFDRSAIRSVGLPYSEVMRRLKIDFPLATTSVACLRWYCVKAREGVFGDGIALPQRRPWDRHPDQARF
jgi:hypothetical protein